MTLTMTSFSTLSSLFEKHFSNRQFPEKPEALYDAAQYILAIGGKRVRPVSVLMAGELFGELNDDLYKAATAIELFHNFSLIHDDIMDKAPLRRGMETVHQKYGESTALLAGDVMLVRAYEELCKIQNGSIQQILHLFNTTSREVCEGQQMDMDFEKRNDVELDEYIRMIALKTSVLLGAALKMGSLINGASVKDSKAIYDFGKNLGIAFQIQDDYLDAFGDPAKVGKQPGGDILANKKTFLTIHFQETATDLQKQSYERLLVANDNEKINGVLELFRQTGADVWAGELKENYFQQAMRHLAEIEVGTDRKEELEKLARYLLQRES
jgi:geranylgeranyl diphosphate synthase type II